ncbi:MAG: DNA polymerase III subunit delta [Chloroflexota bacterium]
MDQKQNIYLLHGDDEYTVTSQIAAMEAKMGDPSTGGLNITRVEKGSFDIERITAITQAMPFLADRRLVIIYDPLASLKGSTQRDRFKKFLGEIPPTTSLVLMISRPLLTYQEKKKNKKHWLQVWAESQNERVYQKEFLLPRGPQMIRWIQTRARKLGGEITPQASGLLSSMVGDNPRIAAQELVKLLTYVDYGRAIDNDDVEHLVAYQRDGDVFAMVDAVGMRNGKKALRLLHELLKQDEPLRLFGMIVRQFRLLLLTHELLDGGNREKDIARQLKIHPFVASKLIPQTRNFSLDNLEDIYRQLLSIDEAVKTSQIEGDVALDMFITALST